MSENKHAAYDLKQMQSLPLEAKIEMSKRRIKEWHEYWDGNVYVSFSGGKDSTVLLNLVRSMYPDVTGVFVDTGLEYPEIRGFVKTYENIEVLRPSVPFTKVIQEYGYPVISKEVSRNIHDVQEIGNECWAAKNKFDSTKPYNIAKFQYLINAPFKISNRCCDVMKKRPFHNYEKITGNKPYIGTMASESNQRRMQWLKSGCNSFDGKASSKPLSFWTEQDILKYIFEHRISIASIYGSIIRDGDKLKLTGAQRTGCMFCMYGCHLEKEPNRFQRMKITHPKQYEYCMRDVEDGGLGLAKVLDYIGVNYK